MTQFLLKAVGLFLLLLSFIGFSLNRNSYDIILATIFAGISIICFYKARNAHNENRMTFTELNTHQDSYDSCLDEDEELSFEFFNHFQPLIKSHDDKLYFALQAIGTTGPRWLKSATREEIEIKIQACQNALSIYDDFKAFCYNQGRGGALYFNEMYEHCHNSKNPDFRYIQSAEIKLETLTQHLKTLN